MKNLLFIFLILPLLATAQTSGSELIFEISEIRVSPDKVKVFEAGVAAHNKRYHPDGAAGARVYWVANGPHTGEYRWVMGPGPWSSYDTRPSGSEHDNDWQQAVAQHTMMGGSTDYIRLDPAVSRFPRDFTLNKLMISYHSVAKGRMSEVKDMLKMGHTVYTQKIPNETYGIYFNEMEGSGYDFSIVWFFDKYGEIPVDNGFGNYMEEVHGQEAAEKVWKDWSELVTTVRSEIWEFRPDLSGLGAMVKAAERD